MPVSVRLDADIEQRLDALARATGGSLLVECSVDESIS
jgi:predicted transcriptional regulator